MSNWFLRPVTLVPALVGVVTAGILWQVRADPGQPAKAMPRAIQPAGSGTPGCSDRSAAAGSVGISTAPCGDESAHGDATQPSPPAPKPVGTPAATPAPRADSEAVGPSMYA